MTHPQFDPSVIERYAEQLYRKADSVRVGSIITGAVLGAIVGAAPMTPFDSYLPIPATFGMAAILIGALLGGFLGYAIGESRAFRIRLQAQMVLFQLQLERNTAAATQVMVAAAAPSAPPAYQPAPAVVPAPQQPVPATIAPAAQRLEPVIPVQRAAVALAHPAPTLPVAEPASFPAPIAAPPPVLAPRPALD